MEKKKDLPIKVFEKRENADERLTEGMSSKTPPSWVLKGDELYKQSEILAYDLNITQIRVKEKFDKFQGVPTIIKAKVSEDIIAKSHRKELNQFFTATKDNNRFIGVSGNHELLLRVDNLNQLNEINSNVKEVERNEKVISGVENINSFEPEIIIDNLEPPKNGKYIFKIRLFDFNNYQLNAATLSLFKNILRNNNHMEYIKSVKYAEDLYLHEISVDSIDSLQDFKDFSPVMSIEPMPVIEVVVDDFFTENEIKIPQPNKDIDYPIVGILDSGITDIPALIPWKHGEREANYPGEFLNLAHGTFVAGIVNFGDVFEEKNYTGTKGFKLLDAAVFPDDSKESITEGDLINNIRGVTKKYRDNVKVWNLSLGTKCEVKNSEFSSFGIALDSIQDENEILIIKSAGNCDNFLSGKPTSRIARGADSVRALTIGSIAQAKDKYDIADLNHASPFSRVGPGPVNIIKPELVHYGGNYGINKTERLPNGVHSLNVDGTMKAHVGTSFSTPRVTAIAADLHSKLDETFDSVLLKALLLHSAKYPSEIDLPINEKLNQVGFGIPSKADDILYNDQHEITLILRDTLNKGEFIEILDFPYPESLIENGYYYGEVVLTLVNIPILAGGQGPEYCQSNIEVYLGTYDQKVERSGRTIRNPIGRSGGGNILKSSIYGKKKPRDTEGFARSEKTLVQYGTKFYPNKKYAVDLNELTPANKKKMLSSPKKWYLKLEGLYREFIETKAELERMELSQEFCVIITIRDPFRKQHVYDEVSNLLQSNNFIHKNVKIRQDIDISLD